MSKTNNNKVRNFKYNRATANMSEYILVAKDKTYKFFKLILFLPLKMHRCCFH